MAPAAVPHPENELVGGDRPDSGDAAIRGDIGLIDGVGEDLDGENHVGAGMRSADHHHGEAETGIYILSGHPVFVFAEGQDEVLAETSPGDYIVPPYVPHREENPSRSEEASSVTARSSQESIVVNLPSLWVSRIRD